MKATGIVVLGRQVTDEEKVTLGVEMFEKTSENFYVYLFSKDTKLPDDTIFGTILKETPDAIKDSTEISFTYFDEGKLICAPADFGYFCRNYLALVDNLCATKEVTEEIAKPWAKWMANPMFTAFSGNPRFNNFIGCRELAFFNISRVILNYLKETKYC